MAFFEYFLRFLFLQEEPVIAQKPGGKGKIPANNSLTHLVL